MTTTLLILFLIVCALAGAGVGAIICGALWAAKGSPDINGDPERDAGLLNTPTDRGFFTVGTSGPLGRTGASPVPASAPTRRITTPTEPPAKLGI